MFAVIMKGAYGSAFNEARAKQSGVGTERGQVTMNGSDDATKRET